MKIVEINSVCGIRSTGRIASDIIDIIKTYGYEGKMAFGREQVPQKYINDSIRIGTQLDIYLHALGSKIFDNTGFYSKRATKKFLEWLDAYNPDLIHLHNIHGYYINIELLFSYIKEKQKKVIWTLHDCWAFTGHCAHFAAEECNKWKKQCEDCSLKKDYPSSILFEQSKKNYQRKKEIFSNVENMVIVTPSEWLASMVKESFLKDYSISVIPNGIDLSVFCPRESDFRKRYEVEDKKIVLGVATAWGKQKGLNEFIELSRRLDEKFKVVLVGLTKQQKRELPNNIIGIERTNSPSELAEIYTAADVLLSMSREETMGLTVVEANACGTPAVVFNTTALPELLAPDCGIVLEEDTVGCVVKTLNEVDFSKFKLENCVKNAKRYEKKKMYEKYVMLYKEGIK